MQSRNILGNLSCLDHRYSLSEAAASEQASIVSCAKAEIALVKAHLDYRGRLTSTGGVYTELYETQFRRALEKGGA